MEECRDYITWVLKGKVHYNLWIVFLWSINIPRYETEKNEHNVIKGWRVRNTEKRRNHICRKLNINFNGWSESSYFLMKQIWTIPLLDTLPCCSFVFQYYFFKKFPLFNSLCFIWNNQSGHHTLFPTQMHTQ